MNVSISSFVHRVIGGLISCFGERVAQWISSKWWEVPPPKPRAKAAEGGTHSQMALLARQAAVSETVTSLLQSYRERKDGFLWLRWLFVSEETQKTVRLLFGEDSNPSTRFFTVLEVRKQESPRCFCETVKAIEDSQLKKLCNEATTYWKEILGNPELREDARVNALNQLVDLSAHFGDFDWSFMAKMLEDGVFDTLIVRLREIRVPNFDLDVSLNKRVECLKGILGNPELREDARVNALNQLVDLSAHFGDFDWSFMAKMLEDGVFDTLIVRLREIRMVNVHLRTVLDRLVECLKGILSDFDLEEEARMNALNQLVDLSAAFANVDWSFIAKLPKKETIVTLIEKLKALAPDLAVDVQSRNEAKIRILKEVSQRFNNRRSYSHRRAFFLPYCTNKNPLNVPQTLPILLPRKPSSGF